MEKFEKLRLRYEETVLERINDFVSTNNEVNGVVVINHIRPRFDYWKLAQMVEMYANEGYVECDKIDEIIAPAMIDDYRIYDNIVRNMAVESRSSGLENVWAIISILAKTDHTKFPRLKEGLINHVLTDNSNPIYLENPCGLKRKFDMEELKNHVRGFISEDLFEELFGERKESFARVYENKTVHPCE